MDLPNRALPKVEDAGTKRYAGQTIRQVNTEYFGTLPAPKNFTKLAAVLKESAYGIAICEGWRGQPKLWKVQSSAVRRIKYALSRSEVAYRRLQQLTSLEQQVMAYERRLLDEARMKGFGFRLGRELSDIELLACLQHYGAATRLLDFTKNVFIALWFACQEYQDSYGLLIGIDTAEPPQPSRLKEPAQAKDRLEDLIGEDENELYLWKPMSLFERIRVQQSIFLFGYSHDGYWGSLTEGEFDTKRFFGIAVSPELKEDMTMKWRVLLGYEAASLFPDIEGFGRYHGAKKYFEYDYFD